MVMLKIKRDDEVVVVTGKDKGKRGKVLKVLDNGRLLVSGVQMIKKHQKPNPNAGIPGGIIEKEAPIQASNVAIFNSATNKADRVGFKVQDDNKKIRVFKSSGEAVDA
ncbi:MAG: large subunit ribosomal protein L24 [Flavobacteriaceae bacterium]|jgi:large subunit ribosomal protein L24|tara:strand:- start:4633 stop:4956 length:324 start_codon:yes stop_codon:yes gene_type:complete